MLLQLSLKKLLTFGYHVSKKCVTNKIMILLQEYNKLIKYPNKKMGKHIKIICNSLSTTLKNCLIFFVLTMPKEERKKIKKRARKCTSTEDEYKFYEDQKGPHKAKCLKQKVSLQQLISYLKEELLVQSLKLISQLHL